MGHIVVKELKSDTRLYKGIYLQDFFFITAYSVGATFLLGSLVSDRLMYAFAVFNVAAGIYLTRPSRFNPGKRKYQEFLIYFRQDTSGYHPIQENRVRHNTVKQSREDRYD